MKALRIPLGVWDWKGTALVVVLLLAPLLATLMLAPDGDVLSTASSARNLLVGTATLAAGVFLYLHWRISASNTTGWLALARMTELPSWVRARVAVALFLLGLGSVVGGEVALVTGLAGAVLLAGTAAAVLHLAIKAEKQRVVDLSKQLQVVESGVREDRARLHEIDATVAGIASAQRLMDDGLAADRSDALAAMMRAEVERLQRLMADRAPTRRRSVDLDDAVGQIVLAHRARGRVVAYEPCGLRALGRADDIAEVVNVLIDNAAVHGGPGHIVVSVAENIEAPDITVTVTDHGPGVAPELRGELFDWGVHRPGSPGQGIGLHVAAEVAEQLGGRLELVPGTRGASFALHLPAAPREVVTGGAVARAS